MSKRDLSTDPVNLSAMWKKAKKIYTKLKKAGISDIIIAAILGNIAQESSFNHKTRLGKHSGYFGNLPEIENWIIKNFGGYDDIHLTNYLIAGLTGKLPDTKSIWGKDLKDRYDKFLNGVTKNTSVAQATKLWEDAYEKSGGQSLLQRINYANYFYNQILQLNGYKQSKTSDKLNKDLSLPKWANPDFSKSTKQTNNSNYNFTLDNSDIDYPAYNLDNVKTEFDLPVYASNFKRGGKLIKKGQQGVKLHKTIYLKKDGNEPESPHSDLKTWFAGITPEERMDLTALELNNGLSTYKPTVELLIASLGIAHPFSWKDVIPAVLPIAIPAAITAPAWAPVVGTTLVNPATYINIGTKIIPELVKDYITYTAADAASEALTDKGIAGHVNNAIGLEEDHPVGEFIGFGGTSFLRRPLEKGITSAYKGLRGTILPEYALSLAMDKAVDTSMRTLSQQEIEEKAKILTLQLLNLLKTVGDNTVLIYTDEEANDVKRLLSVLNLHPEYGADGSFKFIGQINRKTPFDEALVNLYKYRIKNNFTPTQENISLPNYIINTPNGLDFVNATNNVDKYVTSLTDLPVFATVQKNYRPGVAGIRKTTDIGRAHTQIYKVEDPLDAKTTIIHENIGHGMNPLAPYYLSDIFGNKTMYNVYEDLANNVWNPTVAKVLFRELPLPPVEIQAEVANINQFILKKVAKVYNLSDEQILELSKNNPSLLDLMFKNEVDKLSNLELEAMLNALGSRYGRQLIRFLPGPHGLAAQDLFFNLMSRPETPSNELFLYDSLKQLREQNSLYTWELANSYLKNFKNVLKYGFSVAGVGAVTTDKQNKKSL